MSSTTAEASSVVAKTPPPAATRTIQRSTASLISLPPIDHSHGQSPPPSESKRRATRRSGRIEPLEAVRTALHCPRAVHELRATEVELRAATPSALERRRGTGQGRGGNGKKEPAPGVGPGQIRGKTKGRRANDDPRAREDKRDPGRATRSDRSPSTYSASASTICLVIAGWVPIASMATTQPDSSSILSCSGIAVISFDFSSTFVCARVSPAWFAHALTMWIAGLSLLRSCDRPAVFPSMLMICASVARLTAATHETNRSFNASGSSRQNTRAVMSCEGMPWGSRRNLLSHDSVLSQSSMRYTIIECGNAQA